jgi:cytochrome c biogenesis DsbD-like protein
MPIRLTLCVAAALSTVALLAQAPSQQPSTDLDKPGLQASSAAAPSDPIETPHLSVKTSAGDRAAAPGARISLFVDVSPKPKMHVYSPGQKDYISIALTLEPNAAFKAHAAVYPAAEKFFFEPLKETQLVYSKPFRIVQDVTLASGKRQDGALTIKGKLRYQACDDQVCYLPKDLVLTWIVN